MFRERDNLRTKYLNIYIQSPMYLCKLLIIIFCHSSLAILQFPYPMQTFQLPNHPLNWMCTVHITVATFANYTSSDITERFLASNREKIIPTVGTMLNRSIVPVNSFFEPCTVSVLIDATVHGSSYVFEGPQLYRYFSSNEYVNRGWRHSIIILIYFSCYCEYRVESLRLPHRLFYHSLDCGHQNIFPNEAFVPSPLHLLRNINEPTHSIHHRQLPLALRRSISTPKYAWDRHDPNIKPERCLASRWMELSQMLSCEVDMIAAHHYQFFLNFTTVANTPENWQDYGELVTNEKSSAEYSISSHAVDSINERILYCDRNSDSPRHRPIILSSPFSFETWVTLVLLLILCAIASSFAIFDMCSVSKNWTTIVFIKTTFNSLLELIMCLIEKDVGRKNIRKALVGLIAICIGNTYKNYLTIELVYPRCGDAIRNVTELLDLSFNIIIFGSNEDNKSTWPTHVNFNLEIDEIKRGKYVREAETWLRFIYSVDTISNELASVTSKNAWVVNAPYYFQVHFLNLISDTNFPLSCHFVKRAFAHEFSVFHFFNPKAEEFKWWTAKFLDHGLFEFWKRLHSHMLTLKERKTSLENRTKRSNSSSVGAFDVHNFIRQVHLIVFYTIIGISAGICVTIYLLECAMQNAQARAIFVLIKFKRYSLQLLWTIVRSLFLMSRFIGRLCQNCNSPKITPERARIDNILVNKIHKFEVKPQQQ
jgi:hypothetical protein